MIKLKPRLVPCVLTGQGKSDDLLMNENEQQNIIHEFRMGTTNLMIATDIAQEGLDVPNCQYVIRYEFVSNEIGTIQSRGRARAKQGQCFLITVPSRIFLDFFNFFFLFNILILVKESMNERRELKNREKEQEINEALIKLSKVNRLALEDEFNIHLAKKVSTSLKLTSNSPQLITKEPSFKFKPHSIKVHCKDCSKELFTGADIRCRSLSYYCISRHFIERHIRVNNEDKKFFCSDSSCNKDLGRLVEFRNAKSMFMIDIKGIKWLTSNGKSFESIKKWSKVAEMFKIEQIS